MRSLKVCKPDPMRYIRGATRLMMSCLYRKTDSSTRPHIWRAYRNEALCSLNGTAVLFLSCQNTLLRQFTIDSQPTLPFLTEFTEFFRIPHSQKTTRVNEKNSANSEILFPLLPLSIDLRIRQRSLISPLKESKSYFTTLRIIAKWRSFSSSSTP